MISTKNLTKIYTPKKGKSVKAIDNVSIKLPQTGMVFLLGKSGSGKSTLLNLLGGLDNATSGELFIKGKSCKDFKSKDFDAYRNTYVGFVFQEFHILEEYSVGKNIAIALELQKKSTNRQAIEQIMAEVDLDKSYFDRNINELSGGQKQRVSIARALVKNPQIIMADEPTGALDTATGKQIFDTLKKLSQNKLIIVVSHDKDSALSYGDRIIELEDGIIVSDTDHTANEKNSAIDIHNKFSLIKSKLPLKNSFKLGLLALKTKKIRLVFSILLSFIAFTVFGLGLTCATFDQHTIQYQTLKQNEHKIIKIQSQMGIYEPLAGVAVYPRLGAGFSQQQIQKIQQITSNEVVSLHVDSIDDHTTFSFANSLENEPTSNYYTTKLTNLIKTPHANAINLTAATTNSYIPAQNSYNELAISDWVADSLVDFGLKNSSKPINSYEDLLGEHIVLYDGNNSLQFTITGVYKTDVNKNDYAKYKSQQKITAVDEKTLDGRKDLVMSMGYVCANFAVQSNQENGDIVDLSTNGYNYLDIKTAENYQQKLSFACKFSAIDSQELYISNGKSIADLQQNEVIVSAHFFNSLFNTNAEIINYFNALSISSKTISITYCNKFVGTFVIAGIAFSDRSALYLSDNNYATILDAKNSVSNVFLGRNYQILSKDSQTSSYINFAWKSAEYDLSAMNIYWGIGKQAKTSLEDNEVILDASSIIGINANAINDAKKIFDAMPKTMSLGRHYPVEEKIVSGKEINVVGIYFSDYSYWGCHLFSDNAFEYAQQLQQMPFSLIIKLSDNWQKNKELFDYLQGSEQQENGIYTKIQPFTSISSLLSMADTWIYGLKNAFLYASIAFSLFASLLLMNYIGASVADKKKTIGILRAIGATRFDVFKIFLCQGLVIALINFLLSFVSLIIISAVINSVTTLSLLNVGIMQGLLMLALSVVVAVVATFIPAYKIAKKPPIDAINNR